MQANPGDQCFEFGDFQLNSRAGELRKRGIRVHLPDQSVKVLAILLENPGEVVTREDLFRRLWPNGTIVEFDQGVNAAVKRLRAALLDSAEKPRYIETLPKRGYRFIYPCMARISKPLSCVSATSPTAEEDLTGRQFGHYRVMGKLGQGSMATVYRATDVRLGRPVALKFLAGQFLDNRWLRDRFQREAGVVSALNHPNICTIYDIGEQDGRPYITMELLSGETLEETLRRGPLPMVRALEIANQLAIALQAAHSGGIIHRDIKPANIFITLAGHVKVADFGVARRRESGAGSSGRSRSEGGPVGTLGYMAPEQLEGEEGDERSDLFAFGVVLLEMIIGHKRIEGQSTNVVISAIPTASAHSAKIPQNVQHIIEQCLMNDKRARYGSCKELREDLNLAIRSIETIGRSTNTSARRWTLIALVVIMLAATLWVAIPAGSSHVPTIPVPLTTYQGDEVAPSFSPDGNHVAFAWNPSEILGEGKFNIYIKMIGGGDPIRLTNDPANDYAPAWSPDGRFVAFVRTSEASTGVYLIPAIGGVPRRLADICGYAPDGFDTSPLLSWSPDSQWIVVGIGNRNGPITQFALFRLSVKTGEKQQLTYPPPGTLGDLEPAVSPDGTAILFMREAEANRTDLYLLELSKRGTRLGEPKRLTFETTGREPTWTPDGRAVVFLAGPVHAPTMWKMQLSRPGWRPSRPERLPFTGEGVLGPVISRQGALAYSRTTFDVDIFRAEVHGGRPAVEAPTRLISSTRLDDEPRYSPDGKRITFTSNRSGSLEIWVCKSDGSDAQRLTSFGVPFHTAHPRWSPDGRFIAFVSNRDGKADVYVVKSEGGQPTRVRVAGFVEWSLSEWSRDGQWIYAGSSSSGTSQLWKIPWPAASHERGPIQVTRNGFNRDAMESADGRFLFYLKEDGGLWKMPLGGGDETRILRSVWVNNFAVVPDGVYFIPVAKPFFIRFLDFRSGREGSLLKVPQLPAWGFTLSPDGHSLLFSEQEPVRADLMLVENFPW